MSKQSSGRPWAVVALPGIIKRTAKDPTTESVHRLRTTLMRLETLLLCSSDAGDHKKLLKLTGRVRKSAGQVRDVDVHLGILQHLDRRGVSSDYSELKSYLKRRRTKREKKLVSLLGKLIDDGILERLNQIEIGKADSGGLPVPAVDELAEKFLRLASPAPSDSSLHRFRLSCKHLRYSAELARESRERGTLIADLKKVQDSIGAWHDVLTLRAVAEALLGTTRPIISLLRTQAQCRFNEAQRTIAKARRSVARTFNAGASARKPPQHEPSGVKGRTATA
jgi:CHAD domain-containing protein